MFSGFQPGLVEARQRPRLLSESDPGLELPQLGSGNNVLYLLHFPEMNYFLAMKYFLSLCCQADWAQFRLPCRLTEKALSSARRMRSSGC